MMDFRQETHIGDRGPGSDEPLEHKIRVLLIGVTVFTLFVLAMWLVPA